MCLAIPGQILSIGEASDSDRIGRVSFGGVVRQVSLSFVPDARVGDWVIVHVGFALSILDQEEAQAALDLISQVAD